MYEESENQRMISEMISKLAKNEIIPYRMEWDEEEKMPLELLRKFGELGLMGVLVPHEYGGSGFGYPEYVTAISQIGKADGAIGLSVAAHNSLCTGHILQHGSEDQKKKYLPELASGKKLGAWGLTEPNTGSDAMNMRTVAVKDGNDWILNGAKNFITHGNSGDIAVVVARTGEVRDSHGISAFIVERDNPGLKKGRKERKLGMRASETTEMIFEDCRVKGTALIGNEGEGFIQSLKVLDGGRISIAALSLGIAEGALEESIKYSKERKQFGKRISDFQGISFKLAEMEAEVEAARLLTLKAAHLKDEGKKVTKASAIAKYYASEVAVKVSTEAVQIFGGYGYTKEYPVEKYYRDSKLCTIGEGTTEIQKLVISREILKD